MEVNDKSPDFNTTDENGKEVALKDFRGKTVVLYFYPKADTPGCTKEACGFRDSYSQIKKTGVVLLGISADTASSQKKFQDKFSLPFPLLADAEKKIANLFGVVKEKNMYGKKVKGIARTTFVIGPDGKIAKVFPSVKVDVHVDQVLAFLGGGGETAKKPAAKRAAKPAGIVKEPTAEKKTAPKRAPLPAKKAVAKKAAAKKVVAKAR